MEVSRRWMVCANRNGVTTPRNDILSTQKSQGLGWDGCCFLRGCGFPNPSTLTLPGNPPWSQNFLGSMGGYGAKYSYWDLPPPRKNGPANALRIQPPMQENPDSGFQIPGGNRWVSSRNLILRIYLWLSNNRGTFEPWTSSTPFNEKCRGFAKRRISWKHGFWKIGMCGCENKILLSPQQFDHPFEHLI